MPLSKTLISYTSPFFLQLFQSTILRHLSNSECQLFHFLSGGLLVAHNKMWLCRRCQPTQVSNGLRSHHSSSQHHLKFWRTWKWSTAVFNKMKPNAILSSITTKYEEELPHPKHNPTLYTCQPVANTVIQHEQINFVLYSLVVNKNFHIVICTTCGTFVSISLYWHVKSHQPKAPFLPEYPDILQQEYTIVDAGYITYPSKVIAPVFGIQTEALTYYICGTCGHSHKPKGSLCGHQSNKMWCSSKTWKRGYTLSELCLAIYNGKIPVCFPHQY